MKNSLAIIVVLCFTGIISSCTKSDFLDSNSNTVLNEEAVFTDSIRTMAFLTRIYGDVGFSFFKGRAGNGNTEQATDDAEFSLTGVTQSAVILYSATVSPTNIPFSDTWNTPYTNIRRVNLFLSKLPGVPLAPATKLRVEGEARFLRAWYYSQLLIAYGGVPIVKDTVFGLEDITNASISVPRSSWEESVSYVVQELDAAANLLPPPVGGYAEQDYGRATSGACLGLKSRVLLYAASPLFNGGSIATEADKKKVTSYPVYDVQYWQAAADAAQTVINSNYYTLYTGIGTAPGTGFFEVFLKRVNREYIFAFHRAPNKDMEGYYNPASRGGNRYSQPTQNIAEAFPMKNGKAITDPTSGYNPNNPYSNRDPRFNYTIIYNGSLYFSTTTNSKIPVNTYAGAPNDGMDSTGAGSNTTGYYCRKMCDDNISANASTNTERGWPLIRYAEILLNYAEAINETGQTQLAYPKLVELRTRAGIDAGANGLYGLKPNMTVAEMREVIRNERRIELAYEDHRWNDIRRWKIAMVTNNAFNNAIKITGTSPNWKYQVVPTLRRHNFRPEMYLMPIADAEIRKMPALLQNPGW